MPPPSLQDYCPLRVLIAGAGIGGLALAQALRRLDCDVVVYERDASLGARPQGYRIHINPEGGHALNVCLPEDLFDLFRATSGEPATEGPAYLDRHLEDRSREISRFPAIASGPGSQNHPHRAVDRMVLRNILLAGIESQVRYGVSVSDVEETGAGRLLVTLSDGGADLADLLVGADGVGSRVRRRLYPEADIRNSGWRGIYGKTFNDGSNRELLEPFLNRAFTIVSGTPMVSLFLAGFRARAGSAEAASAYPAVQADAYRGDYLMWVLVLPPDRSPFPSPLLEAQAEVAGWHGVIESLMQQADPDTVATVSFRETVELGKKTGPRRATLLGDSLHAMVPAGGEGGNNALQDAAELAAVLASTRKGSISIEDAVSRYESSAIARGLAATQRSHKLAQSLFGLTDLRNFRRERRLTYG